MRPPIIFAAARGLTSLVYGQQLYFGVMGGTNAAANFPRTDYTTPADAFGNPASRFQFFTGNRSLIIGLSAEARLSESFSIEANVLRRPMNSTIIYTSFPAGSPAVTTTLRFTEVEAWEFPLLLKYRLPSRGVAHPFLRIGPEFRSQQNAGATELFIPSTPPSLINSNSLSALRTEPKAIPGAWRRANWASG